jgi:hypothetical protein
MRTVFTDINVKAETKERVIRLKGDQTYDGFVSSLLNKFEFSTVATDETRFSLRDQK